MSSAWASTPLEIYEAHINLPQVGQAAAIRSSLAESVSRYTPQSLLYLGAAGGNGLEALPPNTRVEAVDINPSYLAIALQRFPQLALSAHAADLNHGLPAFTPVHLSFAALLLEYIHTLPALLASLLPLTTHFRVLLLGTRSAAPALVDSPYREALTPVGSEFRYLSPEDFLALATSLGWQHLSTTETPLPAGKHFTTIDLKSPV